MLFFIFISAQELQSWKYELNKIQKDLVGFTDVVLSRGREGESNIGKKIITFHMRMINDKTFEF